MIYLLEASGETLNSNVATWARHQRNLYDVKTSCNANQAHQLTRSVNLSVRYEGGQAAERADGVAITQLLFPPVQRATLKI